MAVREIAKLMEQRIKEQREEEILQVLKEKEQKKSPKRKIIKTEEELKNLTVFDIFYDVFGTTKPKYKITRRPIPPRITEDLIRVKANGKRGIEGSMVFIEFSKLSKFSEKELDDLIDKWHESDTDQTIEEFLGITKEEYKRFVENR